MVKKEIDIAALCRKNVWTSRETAAYLGISLAYLYKLTCEKKIPHYKPEGKVLYFDRSEVEAWMRRGRIESAEALEEQAAAHCRRGGRTI